MATLEAIDESSRKAKHPASPVRNLDNALGLPYIYQCTHRQLAVGSKVVKEKSLAAFAFT
jgi:hypothetical protein